MCQLTHQSYIQVNCILNSIPASSCHKFSNTTCLCNNDNLHDAVMQCVQEACTVLEVMGWSLPALEPMPC